MRTIKRISHALHQANPLQIGVLIFCISLLVRLTLVIVTKPYHDLSRYELERTALSLALTGVYGNPYNIPTGPTAHVSPGYTVLLAGIFRLFGHSYTGEIVKTVWACVAVSFQYALLPWVGWRLAEDRVAGFWAGVICGIFPAKFLMQVDGDWEATYTGIFVLVICAITAYVWRKPLSSPLARQAETARQGLRHGLVWGVGLLFASVILPIFGSCLLIGSWFWRKQLRAYLVFAVVQIVVVAACLSPWILRNQRALGAPIATRSNLGLELRVSNNDQATPDQRINYLQGVYNRYHPLQNRTEAEKVRQLGEVAYNQAAEADARAWINSHPERFRALTMGRMWTFWFYRDPVSKVKTLFLAVTGVLGLLGALLLYRRNVPGAIVVSVVLLLYPAPSYLIQVGLRQRYPIDSLLTLLSMLVSVGVWRKATGQKKIAGTAEAEPAIGTQR